MRNSALLVKKKFSILFKLMKNNKTYDPPLIENGSTIHDPFEQSNIFNKFFASKSSVQDPNDTVPYLQRKEGINSFNMIN